MRIRLAALLFLVLTQGCATSYAVWRPDRSGPYDAWSEGEQLTFDAARRDIDLGRLRLARETMLQLSEARPRNIVVGAWLQEIELALAFEEAAGADAEQDAAEVLERLRERYRTRADEVRTVTNLVLAARVETDQFAAISLLERALDQDAKCAWAHYGMAHVLAQQKEWNGVRRSLERALEIDPGHMWARRLEAWMMARTGQTEDAIDALDTWLSRARKDSRIHPDWIREAQLDLALLYTLDGSPKATRKLLEEAGGNESDPVRAYTLEAAARQAMGQPEEALAAAVKAHELAPKDYLPLVQQAILYESWLDDRARAKLVWKKVLVLADEAQDLSGVVQRARATVHLERLEGEDSP